MHLLRDLKIDHPAWVKRGGSFVYTPWLGVLGVEWQPGHCPLVAGVYGLRWCGLDTSSAYSVLLRQTLEAHDHTGSLAPPDLGRKIRHPARLAGGINIL
jgi:hypothetical protein